MSSSLTSPLVLPCGLSLGNRLAKAAMTEGLATADLLPSPDLLRLYGRWADSGAGLLITGNVGIDADHPVRPRDVILAEGVDLRPFEAWSRTARRHGAKVIMQLNHAGRQTPRFINSSPLGPSAGPAVPQLGAFARPHEASERELQEIVRRHGVAAELARRAGFDGVEVHAAHGYLLNQFLSPDVNRRADAWGGSVANRARLLVECVRAVRAATSPSFAVFVKLNSGDFLRGGLSEDDALEVVSLLHREGMDALEISGGRYESGASFGHATPDPGPREAYFAAFAARAREAMSAPLMLTGGLRTRAAMERVLADGDLDIVGIARPMAMFLDYPRRLLRGELLPLIGAPRVAPRVLARLDAPAELAWYYAQLTRLARGRDADLELSALRALIGFVLGDTLDSIRTRGPRRRAKRPSPLLPEHQPVPTLDVVHSPAHSSWPGQG